MKDSKNKQKNNKVNEIKRQDNIINVPELCQKCEYLQERQISLLRFYRLG